MSGNAPKCEITAQMMPNVYVKTKTKKIGTHSTTDSFTPRKFNSVRKMTMPSENFSFHPCHSIGNMLNIASAPLATLMAMVKI